MPEARRGLPRAWVVGLSLGAGALMLAVLVVFTPWRLLATRVVSIPPWGWLAATLGMSATYALRAGRLRAEWRERLTALGLDYRECLRITLMHNAAVNLLPMRSGEASYAFLLHRRWGVGLGEAAASLLWLRLQDAMVLGVLGLAILLPLPLGARLGFAVAAILAAATLVPRLVRWFHVHARWRRARTHAHPGAAGRKAWHLLAKLAGAFRASRGGRSAWGFAVANWVLKLGVVGALIAPLAGLHLGAGISGALGGELAAVLPLQAPAGVGTYEAGVVLGARSPGAPRFNTGAPEVLAAPPPFTPALAASAGRPDNAGRSMAPADAAAADPRTLLVGAALAVHALMVLVALATALVFSLIMRADPAPESRP